VSGCVAGSSNIPAASSVLLLLIQAVLLLLLLLQVPRTLDIAHQACSNLQ
jgi:hypothetical protein